MGRKLAWLIFTIIAFFSQVDLLTIHLRLVTIHGVYMIDITVGSIKTWSRIGIILMMPVQETSMYEYGERGTVRIDAVNCHFSIG